MVKLKPILLIIAYIFLIWEKSSAFSLGDSTKYRLKYVVNGNFYTNNFWVVSYKNDTFEYVLKQSHRFIQPFSKEQYVYNYQVKHDSIIRMTFMLPYTPNRRFDEPKLNNKGKSYPKDCFCAFLLVDSILFHSTQILRHYPLYSLNMRVKKDTVYDGVYFYILDKKKKKGHHTRYDFNRYSKGSRTPIQKISYIHNIGYTKVQEVSANYYLPEQLALMKSKPSTELWNSIKLVSINDIPIKKFLRNTPKDYQYFKDK
jgi:hypothetical protein